MSKKRQHMVIDEHVHVGSEVDGPLNVRRLMIRTGGLHDLEIKAGVPSHTAGNQPIFRKYFVDAGRWDKKYLDLSLIPPLTIEDLVYYMDDAGIDMSVLVGRDYQCPWPPYTRVVETADYVAHCVEKTPDRFVGVAPINPWEMNVHSRIKYYIEDLHLKGVGEVYTPTGIWPDDEELMYPIYEQCVEHDCTIFIHMTPGRIGSGLVGRGWYLGRPLGDPRCMEQVGYDFPDLKVMMHSGPPGGIVAQLCKNFPNMYTQVGGWAIRLQQDPAAAKEAKAWALYCQENIPDKVVFGSDYPWGFPQGETAKWYMNIPELTDEFKKKLFETNVKKFYKL